MYTALTYMLSGLVEISSTRWPVELKWFNSTSANSWRSPERIITFGTVAMTSRMELFSAAYAAQESTVASCVHKEVNGTEVITNLNVEVEFTWVIMNKVDQLVVISGRTLDSHLKKVPSCGAPSILRSAASISSVERCLRVSRTKNAASGPWENS